MGQADLASTPKPDEKVLRLLDDEQALALHSTRFLGETYLGLAFHEALHVPVLDALDLEDFDELLIAMFRGFGKSTALSCWLTRKIARDPDFRAVIFSRDEEDAEELVTVVRSNLETLMEANWPRDFTSRHWTSDSFTVSGRSISFREPTLYAMGFNNPTPGKHHNVVLCDDLDNEKSVDDPDKIARTRRKKALLAPICDVGEKLHVTAGTMWSDADILSHLIERYGLYKTVTNEDGFDRRAYVSGMKRRVPMMLPGGERGFLRTQLFWLPVEDEHACPTYPERFPAHEIARQRMLMTAEEFSAQYLLDPIPIENAKFKADDFKYDTAMPKDNFELWCGGDFASSMEKGSDFCAFAVCAVTHDYEWFVVEADRYKLDGKQLIEKLFDLHRAYPGIRFVLEEDRYATGVRISLEEKMLAQREILNIEWIKFSNRKQKTVRIEALQGLFRMKRVTLMPGQCESLKEELLRFPRGSKKDVADAFANVYERAQSSPKRLPTAAGPNERAFAWEEAPASRSRRSKLGDDWQNEEEARMLMHETSERTPWRAL